jgi:hypothetical protein
VSAKKNDPIVRVAPLGELRAWLVYEHELDQLASGSPASLLLNFGLALLSIFASFLATLLTASFTTTSAFVVFVCICIISFISGVVCLAIWYSMHVSTSKLIDQIKNRMPPPEGQPIDLPT